MAPDESRLEEAEMEDCTVLDEIQRMVVERAGALGLRLPAVRFEHCATMLDRLKVLRDEVYTLAPNFINMDYPYWEQGWASFPRMYSTTWHRDIQEEFTQVNDFATSDHPIDTLPQNCTSFDRPSLRLYRNYLKSLVYWLKKFRYIKAPHTWYDRSYKRKWVWTQSWDWVSWKQKPHATINGSTSVEDVDESTLRSQQDGVVRKEGPGELPRKGYLQVTWQESGWMRKSHDHKDAGDNSKPLTETVEGEHVYEVGQYGDGVPGNLTTANPTSYEADLLWFIVPESNRYFGHEGNGLLVSDKQDDLVLQKVELVERINLDTFKVRAVYGEDPEKEREGEDEDDTNFTFDSSGGTMHMDVSLETKGKFPADAPDFKRAINVDNESNVNGCEIVMPTFQFSETRTVKASKVNASYKRKIAELTGTVNAGAFKGFEPGEVLFLGATGSKKGKKRKHPWEITFKFAVSPNKENLKVGDITVDSKDGWDYLWVKYEDEVSDERKNLVKKPVAVYVEKVYERKNFSLLKG